MPNTISEGQHAGEFIIEDAGRDRASRSPSVAARRLVAGARRRQGYARCGDAGGVRRQRRATPARSPRSAVGLGAKAGVYKLVCIEPATNAGKFTVEDPDGVTVGIATVAVEFTGGGLDLHHRRRLRPTSRPARASPSPSPPAPAR